MTDIERAARRLAKMLRLRAEAGSVTPEERKALDLVAQRALAVATETIEPTCEGAEDDEGRPDCRGWPVRLVTFNLPAGSTVSGPMGARWCPDCLSAARAQDYEILTVDAEPVPHQSPSGYPCKNARNGCRRRVTREGEHCTDACAMEYLGEEFPARGRHFDRED